MKSSPFRRYSRRKNKRLRYQHTPYNYFPRIDNRNRCLSDTVFGKPRADGCDCKGCVEARRISAQLRRGIEICEMFSIPKTLADVVDVLLTDQDINEIIISRIGSEEVNQIEK